MKDAHNTFLDPKIQELREISVLCSKLGSAGQNPVSTFSKDAFFYQDHSLIVEEKEKLVVSFSQLLNCLKRAHPTEIPCDTSASRSKRTLSLFFFLTSKKLPLPSALGLCANLSCTLFCNSQFYDSHDCWDLT